MAWLLASMADAMKKSAATLASTSAATSSAPTSAVVDGLRTIAAAVVRLKTTAVVAKARLLLETLEEDLLFAGETVRQSESLWL